MSLIDVTYGGVMASGRWFAASVYGAGFGRQSERDFLSGQTRPQHYGCWLGSVRMPIRRAVSVSATTGSRNPVGTTSSMTGCLGSVDCSTCEGRTSTSVSSTGARPCFRCSKIVTTPAPRLHPAPTKASNKGQAEGCRARRPCRCRISAFRRVSHPRSSACWS